MSKLIEIKAIFIREFQRWDTTVLAECLAIGEGDSREKMTIKTTADLDELQGQLSYQFYGSWQTHPKYGPQFVAKTFVRCQPHGQNGVIRYLMNAPGIGRVTAEWLWTCFRSEAVRLLRENPDVAASSIPNLTEATAKKAAAYLAVEKDLEDCQIDLIDLLAGRHFPKATAKRAIRRWGNKSVEFIRANPYRLMTFPGIGFGLADAMYLDFGLPPNRLKRQTLLAWHMMQKDGEGHTWQSRDAVVAAIHAGISGAEVRPGRAVRLGVRAGMIAHRRDPAGALWLACAMRAKAEQTVADCVAEAKAEFPEHHKNDWIHFQWHCQVKALSKLTSHQSEKLYEATAGSIGILGGTPGTGKTFAVAQLIKAIGNHYGWNSIAACAPTGKAAVRMTEALAAAGIPIRARTIHSTLRVSSATEGVWGFDHNASNPLPEKFIFVDEVSMTGVGLMASLLSARRKGGHVLFVGDVNQLTPVGHGKPLADMIAAGIPYGKLTQIHRNSGDIVAACKSINETGQFQVRKNLDPKNGANLGLIHAGFNNDCVEKVIDTLKKITTLDRVWDCQVIVAINTKSKASKAILNQRLQAELNPGGQSVHGCLFKNGDKIVCLSNGFMPIDKTAVDPLGKPRTVSFTDVDDDLGELTERGNVTYESFDASESDGKTFIANGELGQVIRVYEKYMTARFSNPHRLITIPRGKASKDDTGCNFDLGYAISCHKSQGSEWPCVIVVLDISPAAKRVCSREWIYTAISRAKMVCLLVGQIETAIGFCGRQALSKRKTFLTELLNSNTETCKWT